MGESTETLRLRSTGVVVGGGEHRVDIAVASHGGDASVDGKLLDTQVETLIGVPAGLIV